MSRPNFSPLATSTELRSKISSSRISFYLATSFSVNSENDRYIEMRGKLISLWATQVEKLTLVTDMAISFNDFNIFSNKYQCINIKKDNLGDKKEDIILPQMISCYGDGFIWSSKMNLLLTSCAGTWFGAEGPCCKFDYAIFDYFSSSSSSETELSDWFIYSDDDLYIRPKILNNFLSNFDYNKNFVFGANQPGRKFQGRAHNRAVKGKCQHILSSKNICKHTTVGWPIFPGWNANDSCTERFDLDIWHKLKKKNKGYETSNEKWSSCENMNATNTCISCIEKHSTLILSCFDKVEFPGNLQPIIASRGALAVMKPHLQQGNTIRNICGEWNITHDGALSVFVWMMQVPYFNMGETIYSFAGNAESGQCWDKTSALIDRVKSPSSITKCLEPPPQHSHHSTLEEEELKVKEERLRQLDVLETKEKDWVTVHRHLQQQQAVVEEEEGDVTVWDKLLSAKEFKLARPFVFDTILRSNWYRRHNLLGRLENSNNIHPQQQAKQKAKQPIIDDSSDNDVTYSWKDCEVDGFNLGGKVKQEMVYGENALTNKARKRMQKK